MLLTLSMRPTSSPVRYLSPEARPRRLMSASTRSANISRLFAIVNCEWISRKVVAPELGASSQDCDIKRYKCQAPSKNSLTWFFVRFTLQIEDDRSVGSRFPHKRLVVREFCVPLR